ncbi:hypothetical protein BGX31_007523 [Mortierella sp. GBA43]|nr:hypothetical protein BGX31_007523 [Mortierella sp. GBA43]
MSTQHQPYPAFQTYNHELVFEKLYHSQVAGGAGDNGQAQGPFLSNTTTCPIRETLAPSEILAGPLPSMEGYSEDDDESVDQHDVEERHSVHDQELIDQYDDSGMDVAMSGLAMRRQSEMSDIEPAALGRPSQHDTIYYHKDDLDDGDDESCIPMANKTRSRSKKTAGVETDSANLTTKTSSRKAKGSTITKAGPRKRTSAEDESPDAKRQRFLERNRLAASKCREKKRLQTLKTISDADEITARNQALHETLDQLQEEVRQLKNQILSHRDCGCDVIQKFVKSSFGMGSLSSSCSSPTSPTSATEMTATMPPPRLPMY